MTWLTTFRAASKNVERTRQKWRSTFVDSLRIHVQGGAGGMGHPKYGGMGGRGGRVFVEGREDMTLKELKSSMRGNQRVKASFGQNSCSRSILGKPGDDIVIQCPTGVTIVDELGNTLGEVLKEGDTVMVADGGQGGSANNGYMGVKGPSHTIRLDLKLIADVAFVGFPNAGKSTMLSKLSRATPKIASYPFTTLRPTVGIVEYPDMRQISLADLPGLIEGAHVNKGLGHRFLRHVERSKVLLLVVDVQGFQLGHRWPYRTCIETILLLNKELELYKEYLLGKPTMLLINKMDTKGAKELCEKVIDAAQDLKSILHNYPENLRPERPFEFMSIQSISAVEASERQLYEINCEIRRVVDLSIDETEAEVAKEFELLEKIERRQTEYGPGLM